MARGFRHWPIGHPQEFVLLFGTPVPGVAQMEEDCESPDHPGARLGAVFMAPFARLLVGWVRLYGVVALEVFGHLRWAVDDVEPLFEAELAAFVRQLG